MSAVGLGCHNMTNAHTHICNHFVKTFIISTLSCRTFYQVSEKFDSTAAKSHYFRIVGEKFKSFSLNISLCINRIQFNKIFSINVNEYFKCPPGLMEGVMLSPDSRKSWWLWAGLGAETRTGLFELVFTAWTCKQSNYWDLLELTRSI